MWFGYHQRCSDCRLQEGQKAQEAGGRQLFHDDVNEIDNRVVKYGETGRIVVQLGRNTDEIPLLPTRCLRRTPHRIGFEGSIRASKHRDHVDNNAVFVSTIACGDVRQEEDVGDGSSQCRFTG